jgi:hypothetical protein
MDPSRKAGLVAAVLTVASFSVQPARAADIVEAGTGWQDTGAIEGTLEWPLRIQGSRKDVPAYIGWRHLGETRVYWAPFARLNYVNFWSIGGGGNLLAANLAPAGIGVYLSEPPAAVSSAERAGRWFATLELNLASIQIGGNITPGSPADSRIPDPNAYRAQLQAEVQQQGGVQAFITQHYPLGSYQYVTLATPIQIRAWTMVTPQTGVGFFVEGHPLMLEWAIGRGASATPAYGYAVTAGFSAIFL